MLGKRNQRESSGAANISDTAHTSRTSARDGWFIGHSKTSNRNNLGLPLIYKKILFDKVDEIRGRRNQAAHGALGPFCTILTQHKFLEDVRDFWSPVVFEHTGKTLDEVASECKEANVERIREWKRGSFDTSSSVLLMFSFFFVKNNFC